MPPYRDDINDREPGTGDEDLDDWEAPRAEDQDDHNDPDIVPCPYCGAQVSEVAEVCPHCRGFLVTDEVRRPRWWLLVVVVVCILMVLLWSF